MIVRKMRTVTLDEAMEATQGLWVGTAGDVSVVMADGQAVIIPGVASGTLLPIAITQVNTVGTTASDLLACWAV